jgi:hypothetical protein
MQIYNKQVNAERIHAQLEYVKLILAKVSFDRSLFEKELRKAVSVLLPHEVDDLRDWCYQKFGRLHSSVLNQCFLHECAS